MAAEDTASPSIREAADRRARQAVLLLVGLAAVLALAFVLGIGHGAMALPPHKVLAILAEHAGLGPPAGSTRAEDAVVWAIRTPRACLAALVGAALAVSGAALQGLFRNPLADPGLIGVATGAALAAAATIVFGTAVSAYLPPPLATLMLPAGAFLGGLATTLAVYRIASRDGRTEVATMLLAGVAINAIAGAAIGLLVFVSTDQQLRDLNFWLLGSIGGATWQQVLVAVPLILLPAAMLMRLSRQLNALLLGETEARHLGFEVERTKRLIVTLAALAVGTAVAFTGVIGFVGLVVPHLIRLVAGPDHRLLMPAAAMLGAALTLVADLFARTLAVPAELPIGILTSCVGGPFFLYLLTRRKGVALW